MTQLLVSVRDLAEAKLAQQAGVDLIDIKEPQAGSLGAADVDDILDVLDEISDSTQVSVALGELCELTLADRQVGIFAALKEEEHLQFAKLGLAYVKEIPEWKTHWNDFMMLLPEQTGRVAVAYADWEKAASIPPVEVLQFAVDHRCTGYLIDTYEKDGSTSLDYMDEDLIEAIINKTREFEITSVLAGSLSEGTLQRALDLAPDYVAVRGAACEQDRTSGVSLEKMKSLMEQVHN
jgi:uncharacterized protein (UPF0264 family)